MAEKHKTKYKAPKDMEKSLKPETRKDIKDYTSEDNYGMVPNSTKQIQPLVARKYATEVIDDVENMVPKITDRLYKKVEQGEYTADHARKVFEKLQIADTDGFLKKLERINHGAITNSLVKPENEETIKESISNLSESEKEQIIRKYVRNKIAKVLRENYIFEQEEEEAPEADAPEADAPEVDTPEADVDTPDVDTPEDTPAADDTPTFIGGGGTSSPSPSPSPSPDAMPAADDSEASADPSSKDVASKMKSSINKFVSDIKSKLATATPIEVAPEVVQPIKDLMKDMTTAKATQFKKAIATAMRNADIKLPNPSPSDDYTENEA
jgi:hypothetical protein|tara:strand:+ start:1862 stop:2836 length:975 start_codon:yes stop_codon:yes gene_type:complete